MLDSKRTREARSEPWPWVCSVDREGSAVDKHRQSRACGRAAAPPRPPSTEGQIHLFIAITLGLCDSAALGLCLGKRLCCKGAKRVLCGFPWKSQHEDGSSSQARCAALIWFHPSPGTEGSAARSLWGKPPQVSFSQTPPPETPTSKSQKGRKAEVSAQHKSFCSKR